jgi:hypothetical protein
MTSQSLVDPMMTPTFALISEIFFADPPRRTDAPVTFDIRFPPDATGEYSSPAKRIPEPLLHAPEPPQLLPYHPGRGSVAEKKNRRDTIRHGGFFSISSEHTNDVRTLSSIVLSDSAVTKKRTWRAVSSYRRHKDSSFFTENRSL